jgi:hypothetical protein
MTAWLVIFDGTMLDGIFGKLQDAEGISLQRSGTALRTGPEGVSILPGLSRHTVRIEDADDAASAEQAVRAALSGDAGRFRDWRVEPS